MCPYYTILAFALAIPTRQTPQIIPSPFHACNGARTANGLKNQRFMGSVPSASVPSASRRLVDMRMKSETGKTLREAILDERLSRAETLLLGGHSVKDVAKRLQFTSANRLTRVFASRRGRTISAWLKDGSAHYAAPADSPGTRAGTLTHPAKAFATLSSRPSLRRRS